MNQKRFGVIYSTLDALLTPVPLSSSTTSGSSGSSISGRSSGAEKGLDVSGVELNPTSTSSVKRSDMSLTTSTTTSHVSGSEAVSTEAIVKDLSTTASTTATIAADASATAGSDALTKRRLQQEPERINTVTSIAIDAIPPSLYTSHRHTTTVKDTTATSGSSRKTTDVIRRDSGTTSSTTSSAALPTPTNGVLSEYDDKQQRKRDPRKKISLATMYNLNGTIGNTAIWNTAVDYLYTHKILNFKVLLPLYLIKERESCVYIKSLLYPPTSPPQSSSSSSATGSGPEWSIFWAWAKIWSRFWVWPAVLFQNLKDPECGIIYCDADTI